MIVIRKLAAAAIALSLSSSVLAYGPHGHRHYHHHHRHGSQWIGPAVAGVVLGSVIANAYARPPLVIQEPVYVNPVPPTVVVPTQCWIEFTNPYTGIRETQLVDCKRISSAQ